MGIQYGTLELPHAYGNYELINNSSYGAVHYITLWNSDVGNSAITGLIKPLEVIYKIEVFVKVPFNAGVQLEIIGFQMYDVDGNDGMEDYSGIVIFNRNCADLTMKGVTFSSDTYAETKDSEEIRIYFDNPSGISATRGELEVRFYSFPL